MTRDRVVLMIVMFVLGFVGILSMLTINIPIPEEAKQELLKDFSPEQIKYLVLINPTVFLCIAVGLGIPFAPQVNLRVPILEGIITKNHTYNIKDILVYGIVGGIISGVLILFTSYLFEPSFPSGLAEATEDFKPSLANRFLYGGFTEEILMRFGLMSFIVWVVSQITKETTAMAYWIGISIAALLFAIGHLPIAFSLVSEPSVSFISYIIIGNSVGGIIFGWLYWKKGLEAAFLAHIFAHVIMVSIEPLLK